MGSWALLCVIGVSPCTMLALGVVDSLRLELKGFNPSQIAEKCYAKFKGRRVTDYVPDVKNHPIFRPAENDFDSRSSVNDLKKDMGADVGSCVPWGYGKRA